MCVPFVAIESLVSVDRCVMHISLSTHVALKILPFNM